ncbi:MAG: metallophosphoesterase [Prolixibacteraceae bacterium]
MKLIYSKFRLSKHQGSGITVFFLLLLFLGSCNLNGDQNASIIQFVYTSDPHFGYSRLAFRGGSDVDALVVNQAMIGQINSLPTHKLPKDKGVNAGKPVGGIDYLICSGDIANRSEYGIQRAEVSWNEFLETYVNGLSLKNNSNQKTELLLLAGNHDISDAIGHYNIPDEEKDNSVMVGIFNYIFPEKLRTSTDFNYKTDKIHYSKELAGIHFMFVNLWPDSCERIWMEKDLQYISDSVPVLLFTHDEPNVKARHFTNPNGQHDINLTDKFENLLGEKFKDGKNIFLAATIEQLGFVDFLKRHSNIRVYFHGNDNENRFYTYTGPENDVSLDVVDVDSPMKGNYSRHAESRLSFQLVTIDTRNKLMTVRECLWNTKPSHPQTPVEWGNSTTISLR